MLKIGLTGGIGSGKSLVSGYFEQQGIVVVDADVIAREVVSPGSLQLERIRERFGTDIIQDDQTLNRSRLRTIIFADQKEKLWLESLLHPVIRERICQSLNKANSTFTMLVSPLLLETTQSELVEQIVVVDAPEEQQIARAAKRDGVSAEQIRTIIASQTSRHERLSRADHVIDNSGTIEETLVQCRKLYKELSNAAML